ncbi:hypothetical protein [Thiorhodococcus mannitoliphagus]|uniref:hypothetical protein n=1 Tax=Thiorhodococcus mannitoliphagus TaxID=329406 RepID=UPI001F1001D1|nr:hypothetical protein [Thiorhodococcus mannitoliphagus]
MAIGELAEQAAAAAKSDAAASLQVAQIAEALRGAIRRFRCKQGNRPPRADVHPMLQEAPIANVAHVIQLAVAPVFLLT